MRYVNNDTSSCRDKCIKEEYKSKRKDRLLTEKDNVNYNRIWYMTLIVTAEKKYGYKHKYEYGYENKRCCEYRIRKRRWQWKWI